MDSFHIHTQYSLSIVLRITLPKPGIDLQVHLSQGQILVKIFNLGHIFFIYRQISFIFTHNTPCHWYSRLPYTNLALAFMFTFLKVKYFVKIKAPIGGGYQFNEFACCTSFLARLFLKKTRGIVIALSSSVCPSSVVIKLWHFQISLPLVKVSSSNLE